SCSASGVASMVTASPTPAAAAAGATATLAPRWHSAPVRSWSRFHTRTSWPASSSRIAIRVPICPTPRNAILDISDPPSAAQLIGDGQAADPLAGRGEDCVTQRGSERRDAGLADAARRLLTADDVDARV